MSNSIPYKNFSTFILRSPLFPFTFIESFVAGRDTPVAELKKVYENPVVQEAIFLASPDLFNQMLEWLKGELKDAKKVERLHYGLMRYIIRMSARPTPFGLFAGFSTGQWAEETRMDLPPPNRLFQAHPPGYELSLRPGTGPGQTPNH